MARSIRIKNHHAEQETFDRRAIVAAFIIALAFLGLSARPVWLQVVNHDYFANRPFRAPMLRSRPS